MNANTTSKNAVNHPPRANVVFTIPFGLIDWRFSNTEPSRTVRIADNLLLMIAVNSYTRPNKLYNRSTGLVSASLHIAMF
jgi:hypothetical protein